MIITRPDTDKATKVEVEAKIGLLVDRTSGQRLGLPVIVETILEPNALDVRFESNMSVAQHRHFNTLLNKLKTTSSQPGYPATPLEYSHLYLVDSFYPSDDKEKIRVTRDEKTHTVVETVKKVRLGDLNIYSPKRIADWRISVNLEIPVPHPRKDRLSYTHEEFVIDLTKDAPAQVLHELEVEIARSDLLLATAAKRGDPSAPEHERSAFDELIRAFVNNARILVRNAGDI
ncbi:mRNA triphosphatase CET1 [Cyathus striatus]|nr:mRNA triphosphatase CET1 [Cyathus striatus]